MRSCRMRLAGMVCALLLMMGGLCGCSAAGEPNSAADLLLRFADNPDNTNCVVDVNVGATVSLAGFRAHIPVTAQLEAADSCVQGTVSADLSAINAGVQDFDVYAQVEENSACAYVQPQEGNVIAWDSSELDAGVNLDIPLVVKLLSDAKFMRVAYDTDDQICYELILPAKDVVEMLLDKGEVTTTIGEVDRQRLLDAVKESKLHVCFNKDCLIRSVSLDLNFTYKNRELVSQPLKVTMSVDAVMDKYGTIDPRETSVPELVRSGSKVTDDPLYAKKYFQKLVESAAL